MKNIFHDRDYKNQPLNSHMKHFLHPLALLAFCILAVLPLRAVSREDTLIDSNWCFQQGDMKNPEQVDFTDNNWQVVSIPHNWGWEEAQLG